MGVEEMNWYLQFEDKLQNKDELYLGGNGSELFGDCIIYIS